jgi:lipopolysaccharide export system ATP-binding protein
MALLEVMGLEKWYGRRKVVDGVSFEVNPGEVVGLLGPNGAGKTTSFRMATGQIVPNGGMVYFDNQDVTAFPMFRRARLGMGYLSQEQSIFRKLSVEKNLLAILEALPRSRQLGRALTSRERHERTEEALRRFNLLHVRKNIAARCSGGEKRRLEIARCLVCEPQLILLDEPFAAVDPKTTEDIRRNIRDLANSGIGILLTDHNVREVVKTADRIYLIVEGKVVCHGTPGELIRNKVAIDAYLGSTFEDDLLMARVAGFGVGHAVPNGAEPKSNGKKQPTLFDEPLPETLVAEPIVELSVSVPKIVEAAPQQVKPIAKAVPAAPPPPAQVPKVVIDDRIPVGIPSRPAMTPQPASVSPPPQPRFSNMALFLLEEEKLRRLVEQLKDREQMPAAWHELAMKGDRSIPVLLEALERRDLEVRHLAYRLLESITGEQLDFQADAEDAERLRQVAKLRAKLERKS